MIGTTLQKLIDEKNTNVNELARTIGVSAQTLYSIIKRDNMKIDFDILLRICDALNVDVDVFYTDYIKNKTQHENIDNPTMLSQVEYPFMVKYRDLTPEEQSQLDNIIEDISNRREVSNNASTQKKPIPSKRDELLELLTANPQRLSFIEQLLQLDSAALEKVERILDIVEALPTPPQDNNGKW